MVQAEDSRAQDDFVFSKLIRLSEAPAPRRGFSIRAVSAFGRSQPAAPGADSAPGPAAASDPEADH